MIVVLLEAISSKRTYGSLVGAYISPRRSYKKYENNDADSLSRKWSKGKHKCLKYWKSEGRLFEPCRPKSM